MKIKILTAFANIYYKIKFKKIIVLLVVIFFNIKYF